MRASFFWTPWSQSSAIVLASTAHEKTVLDLKERYVITDATCAFELAKDLAAFANALGGTVLVGASEQSDALGLAVWTDENDLPNIDVNGALKTAHHDTGPRFVPLGSVA